MTPASQGRLMFPAISAISLLHVAGLGNNFQCSIINEQLADELRWAMPIFMLLVAAMVPFRDIAPAYAGPQMIAEQQLPSDLKRLEVDYGDQLRLVGYRLAEPLARTDSVEFTLYWQCLKPIDGRLQHLCHRVWSSIAGTGQARCVSLSRVVCYASMSARPDLRGSLQDSDHHQRSCATKRAAGADRRDRGDNARGARACCGRTGRAVSDARCWKTCVSAARAQSHTRLSCWRRHHVAGCAHRTRKVERLTCRQRGRPRPLCRKPTLFLSTFSMETAN